MLDPIILPQPDSGLFLFQISSPSGRTVSFPVGSSIPLVELEEWHDLANLNIDRTSVISRFTDWDASVQVHLQQDWHFRSPRGLTRFLRQSLGRRRFDLNQIDYETLLHRLSASRIRLPQMWHVHNLRRDWPGTSGRPEWNEATSSRYSTGWNH